MGEGREGQEVFSSTVCVVWGSVRAQERGPLLGGANICAPRLWRDGCDAEVPASQPRVNARRRPQAGCSPPAWRGHGHLLFHRRASTSRNLLGSRVEGTGRKVAGCVEESKALRPGSRRDWIVLSSVSDLHCSPFLGSLCSPSDSGSLGPSGRPLKISPCPLSFCSVRPPRDHHSAKSGVLARCY